MRYLESFFIRAEPIISEWAEAEGASPEKILRRLFNFGKKGLVFDDFCFRRTSDKCIIGLARISHIALLLQSDNAIQRRDGEAAFKDLQVSIDAVQDFCRVTHTRLPDSALIGQARSAWTDYVSTVPPDRAPTEGELEWMRVFRTAAGPSRVEKRAAASISLSKVRGFPPSRKSPREIHEMSGCAHGTAASEGQPPVSASAPSAPAEATTKDRSSTRSARKWRGYVEKDNEIIPWVLALMDEKGISCNAAVEKIPDDRLAGTGTPESRRKRIYKRIPKTPNR